MRAIVQRVASASVTVAGSVVGSIENGLCVLVGIMRDDKPEDAEYMARKILALRLFENDSGKPWTASVVDRSLELLIVSQFTLYAKTNKNKPDFHDAMAADESRAFYEAFVERLRRSYASERIKEGQFQARMLVNICNDGPVTIQLDSRKFHYAAAEPDAAAGAAGASIAGAAAAAEPGDE